MHIKNEPLRPEERFASSFSAPSEDIDLQWLVRTLIRRKWAIILPALMAALLAALIVTQVAPTYTGYAEVLIDTRQAKVTDIEEVLTDMTGDADMMESQVRVLQSRNLAYKVVDSLQLDQDAEFNSNLQEPTLVSSAVGWVKSQFIGLGVLSPPPAVSPEVALMLERSDVVDNFLKALNVDLLPKSRVIGITFHSEDSERAAQVANKIAELYVLDQLEAKYDATQRATKWLTDKIADLRKSVASSEQAVEKFRSQAGLLQSQGGTLISQQISDLNAQLITVRAARAEAEARLSQVRQLIRTAGGADAAGDVLKSPIIQQLSQQETEGRRKVAELNQEFGDRHPRMISAKAELADVQGKIQREINKVVNALENEVGVARAREIALDRGLDQLKTRLSQSNTAEVQLRALERDADASRAMLESFLARFEQTSAQLDSSVNETNARIISRADVPVNPSFPPSKLIVAVALIGSALFAALIVLGIEQMDRGYRSGEQVEKGTGLRSLGLVPMVRGGSGKNPAAHLLRHPSSMFGESIRSLYTSILLSPGEAPPKKLMVTSSQPKEGKTTIAICLGRMRALSGHSTVIIEADLRRPSIHRALGIPRRPGLTDLILGDVQLSDVLVKDADSGAYIIPAGKLAPDPTEILTSPRMKELLNQLSREFELVVVDSPPIVAVADARLLAPQVDSAVLVVRWAKTGREVVSLAAKQLQEAGGRIAGAVLSMVDSKKHARYGFADSAYYYGPVKRYYTS